MATACIAASTRRGASVARHGAANQLRREAARSGRLWPLHLIAEMKCMFYLANYGGTDRHSRQSLCAAVAK